MENTVFDTPVRVLFGLGMPRDIATPFQAYTFLREHVRGRHGALHEAACASCLAALTQQGSSVAAREAFVAFAERAGILAPEIEPMIAANTVSANAMRLAS